MDWDDARPKPGRSITIGEDLKAHGIAELEARIAALTSEIDRTRAEIAVKKAHSAAAASIFKS
ncbi:MAG: DUF1192 domain-containing protein [Hyphomicrobiaceae bacterium]|nr:DUF1192 domain-containing protein [Hyphomicrobiaceae bacterium]